jgi:NDP-sugar pyrophosphorylase family protein
MSHADPRLLASAFFEGELPGLFEPDEPVWCALNRLGDYLHDVIKPNVSAIPREGGLVTRTVALVDQEVIPSPTITSLDATKGRLTLTKDGTVIEGAALICAGAFFCDDAVEIGPGVLVEPQAYFRGPVRVGPRSEIRHGAYLRGAVLVGVSCVVGHATEAKGSVFLDGAKAGHFAYVGDSILGRKTNLGAGTKLANLKIIEGDVTVPLDGVRVHTGRRKLGAVLGDGTETGCNSVLGPGALLGPRCRVYPNATVPSGLYPSGATLHRRH